MLTFRAEGRDVDATFKDEPGGHRWQRIPPTEKRGRVQTSTITVAVLDDAQRVDVAINDVDLVWRTCRGSGNGGQNRNKRDTAVQLTHVPTGIQVRCEAERQQHQNRVRALEMLRERLVELARRERGSARDSERHRQVGTGMRGDKRRTIRVQDGQVNDHVTGRHWELKRYLRGDW